MSAPRTIQRGSRGAEVERLQRLLGETQDGIFGAITEAALKTWQRARGLVADGVVGPKTWAALEADQKNGPLVTTGVAVVSPVDLQAARPGTVITRGLIERGFPRCADPSAWAGAFTAAAERFRAFTRTGWACILAKANTEAMGLTCWDEDLYYTSADQVRRMFGSRAGADPSRLLCNPRLLGDTVYAHLGGYDGRGLGVIQLTGLDNHTAFARDMGMSLAEARAYMQTIPGAAMTAPWYLDHYGATAKANGGDMRAVLAVVAGKTVAGLSGIWDAIHGDKQMADFERFRRLLSG